MNEVTILISTRNEEKNIGASLSACLGQDYDKKMYKIMVIDDCSTDRTGDIAAKYAGEHGGRVVHVRTESRIGYVKSINLGVSRCNTPFFIEMNADCMPQKNWLRLLMEGFDNKRIVVIKTTNLFEGASSAFRTEIVRKLGMFDERYNEMGSGFRHDTDMMFKILDAGYAIKRISGTGYEHRHPAPATTTGKIKYAISRVKIHRFDPLLYKNHPERTKEMLDIRLGFVRNPVTDFRTATGLWHKGGRLDLSSPQGIKILENRTSFHAVAIIALGICYVLAVKLARLYGSVKFGKLLI
jgi:glycosyltransferase involved in cell wall biosynthesis